MPPSFLLVTKQGHQAAQALAASMQDWLRSRGARVSRFEHPAPDGVSNGPADSPSSLRAAASGTDAVVVLGGDGSFISAARQLAGSGAALLGVNFGRVGFLTEVPATGWEPALEALFDGSITRQPRMALGWEVQRQGNSVFSGHAVNDVVLGRGNLARVANIQVEVIEPGSTPGSPTSADLGWIRADGVIVASPLGSSAYSLSAGGPLVHPLIEALVVTAIAPFLSSMPSLVLPGEAQVRLRCGPIPGFAAVSSGNVQGSPVNAVPGSLPAESETWLTVDGQEGYALLPGDMVTVRRVPDAYTVYTLDEGYYLNNLRQRGFIRDFTQDGGFGRQAP